MELHCIVNPFFQQLNEFPQFDQTSHVQDGRWPKHAGVKRGGSLIGPFSRERDGAGVLVEKREDFTASHFARLENKKPFSQ